MPLSVGARIGPYEIIGWLGAGGMGEVYRAHDSRLGRDVAIKQIAESFAADRNRLHRFEQEARTVGQLNHPNILAVYDFGTHADAPFIVSELLDGESLRSRLQKGPLAARKAIQYARQTADGLAAAHDKGIVHRDLKPENLFITNDDRVKILDFGIAKLTRPADDSAHPTGLPTETNAGLVVGTQGYMSPEQIRGEPVDARSDLFNVGTVLYEMLTGQSAFARATAADTMSAILNEDPPSSAAAISPALARIIARCLEKSREARFQSARDLAFGLEVLSDTGVGALPRLASSKRRRTATALTAAAAIAAIVLVAIWLIRDRRPIASSIDERFAHAVFTPVTNFDGSEQGAAISADGRFIAFLSDREGPFHVWLTQFGTGQFHNLTPGMADQRNPGVMRDAGFSGDGSEIWINGTGADRRLRLIPLMGGSAHVFLREAAVNVAWSTDGARLVYFTRDHGDPMFVADGNGGNEHQIFISPDGNHNHFPVWAPDGQWIYYVHGIQASSEFDVWRIRPTGGPPQQLTFRKTDIRYPTPIDAQTVLYVAPDEDKSGTWLWALDVDNHVSHRINTGLERYSSVGASADGHRLVATVATSAAGLWSVPILDRLALEADARLYSLKMDRALAPRFGPDGSLFFLSSSGLADGLWRFNRGAVTEIWKGSDGPLFEPAAISPVGDWATLVLRKQGKQQLALVSTDGSTHRTLRDDIDIRGTSSWSPDGKWIVTGGNDERGPGLFEVPIDGGPAVRLADGEALDPIWSAAQDLIVYTGPQRATAPLLAVRPDRTAVRLPPIEVPFAGGRRGRTRFLPGGNALVYVQGPIGTQEFWLLDLKTNKTRQLTRLASAGTMYAFDITPDGKQIIFDRVRDNSDIRLIELK